MSTEPHESGSYSSRGSGIRREPSITGANGPCRGHSVSGFMTAAAAASAALFFVLWWMLQGEENPWIPAGLAASVVMLVAASAWLAVVRRSRVRYVRDHSSGEWRGRSIPRPSGSGAPPAGPRFTAPPALHKESTAPRCQATPPPTHPQ